MSKFFCSLAIFMATISAHAGTSEGKIKIAVKYAHGSLRVDYLLPCTIGQTSSLTSEAGTKEPWHIEVKPFLEANGDIRIEAKVIESGRLVQRPTIILQVGDPATTTIENKGDTSELTLEVVTPAAKRD